MYSLDTELKRATKVYAANIKCILRLGYTKRQMTADITKIEVVDGKDTDLCVDKPVYAIHLANVREEPQLNQMERISLRKIKNGTFFRPSNVPEC